MSLNLDKKPGLELRIAEIDPCLGGSFKNLELCENRGMASEEKKTWLRRDATEHNIWFIRAHQKVSSLTHEHPITEPTAVTKWRAKVTNIPPHVLNFYRETVLP